MIQESEFYQGAVLSRIIRTFPEVALEVFPGTRNAAYKINGRVGLYIKYSTSRMTPWTFTFHKNHQDDIWGMKQLLDDVYIALVCRDDGIACLSFDELKNILDEQHEEVEWVRVSRNPRQKYSLSGSNGKMKNKIGENEFPGKIMSSLGIERLIRSK